jgi:NAD-dependent SIR2 family protein deacetylase
MFKNASDGLWENYPMEQVTTHHGWKSNVSEFHRIQKGASDGMKEFIDYIGVDQSSEARKLINDNIKEHS